MDKNTIREISDVVTDEVMALVQKQLADEKPELSVAIANQVIEAVNSKYNSTLRSLLQRNNELERRLDRMEQEMRSQPSASALDDVQKLVKGYQKLEKRIAVLEEKVANAASVPVQIEPYNGNIKPQQRIARVVDGITTLSEEQMEEILSYPDRYREGNGWIYYVKVITLKKKNPVPMSKHDRELQKLGVEVFYSEYIHETYGELFKVHKDGTENQKIFSGKVGVWHGEIRDFKLRENELHFMDDSRNRRSVKV